MHYRYDISVNAYDLGNPRLYSPDYTIILHVLRNLFAPEFLNSPYMLEVPRSTAVRSNIGQIYVRDRDTVYPFNVWALSVIGDGAASSLFGLENDGVIYVARSLMDAPDDIYL